ncbi:MAG: hypothetical protein ABI361_01315 [Nitrososphaera sp.]
MVAQRRCPLCGSALDADSEEFTLCYKCRESGAKIRLEIYEADSTIPKDPSSGFSELFLGKINYRKIRNANIARGGY